MHTFAQRLFLMFGLRRRTAARRTPAALQVDRSNVVPIRQNRHGPQQACAARIGVQVRDGLPHIHVFANEPRTV